MIIFYYIRLLTTKSSSRSIVRFEHAIQKLIKLSDAAHCVSWRSLVSSVVSGHICIGTVISARPSSEPQMSGDWSAFMVAPIAFQHLGIQKMRRR